jgi:oligopeptide transport system permease protein
MSLAEPAAPVTGRSLWADALSRLARNRAAAASAVFLVVMALAAIVGPMLSPHPYDRVYPAYVRVAPSVTAYPNDEQIETALRGIASRFRARIEAQELRGSALRLLLVSTSTRALDERNLPYFDRTDLFQGARVLERGEGGLSLLIEAPIRRHYFLFGTDGNGRDLFSRILVGGRVSLA